MHIKYWFILTNERLISEDTLKSVRVIIATVVGCAFRYLQARALSGASTRIVHSILTYCHEITYHKECLKFDMSATTMDRHHAHRHIYLCITHISIYVSHFVVQPVVLEQGRHFHLPPSCSYFR